MLFKDFDCAIDEMTVIREEFKMIRALWTSFIFLSSVTRLSLDVYNQNRFKCHSSCLSDYTRNIAHVELSLFISFRFYKMFWISVVILQFDNV